MSKRTSEAETFKYRKLNRVELNDYCVKIHIFQIDREKPWNRLFDITTTDNYKFQFGSEVIKNTSTSATLYEKVEKLTKTELIKLFSSLSIHDIWSSEFITNAKDDSWVEELMQKIRGMDEGEAKKYVKKNYTSFGKNRRQLTGQKILPNSENNYYTVRDLKIHFDALREGCGVETAQKTSIRKLDVNSIQYLIFNGVKYELK